MCKFDIFFPEIVEERHCKYYLGDWLYHDPYVYSSTTSVARKEVFTSANRQLCHSPPQIHLSQVKIIENKIVFKKWSENKLC